MPLPSVARRVNAFGYVKRARESKAYFALPTYAPGTIAVNVTCMERGFNACQTLFNRFPIFQAGSSNVRHFSTFFAHFGLPWVRPWDNRSKCYMDGKERGFNAGQTHRSMYPSIFNRFPVIQLVSLKVHHFRTFWHILASPGYAPGTIVVNVTWMKRGFNACKMPYCIYPSIFNHF